MAEENPFGAMGQAISQNAEAERQSIPRHRRHRRAREVEEEQAQQPAPAQQTPAQGYEQGPVNNSSNTAPVDSTPTEEPAQSPEDAHLEEVFGPVDKDMTKISNVELTDIYPNDHDTTDGKKWLMLEFEYTPTVSVYGLSNVNIPTKKLTGTISLNTQVLEDPNAERDQRKWIDNAERKQQIDNLIDYAFGEKYGVHNMEELYPTFDNLLNEDKPPVFDVYQNVFPVEVNGSSQYRTVFVLINRHRTGSFIQTDFVGQAEFKEAVMNNNKLPVKILEVKDNLNTYRKKDKDGTEHVYPFAQIELYAEYNGSNAELHGKKYLIRYRYLNTKDGAGKTIPQAEQTPNFNKRLSQYNLIASKLGLQGDNKTLIDQIMKMKNVDAYATVTRSELTYTGGAHKGEHIFYMKLA